MTQSSGPTTQQLTLEESYRRLLSSIDDGFDKLLDDDAVSPVVVDATFTWLENLADSLAIWAVDVQVRGSSLSKMDETAIGESIRGLFWDIENGISDPKKLLAAFTTEQQEPQASSRASERTTRYSEQQADVGLVVRSLFKLQDLVGTIRAFLAPEHSIGLYSVLESEIDKVYTEHQHQRVGTERMRCRGSALGSALGTRHAASMGIGDGGGLSASQSATTPDVVPHEVEAGLQATLEPAGAKTTPAVGASVTDPWIVASEMLHAKAKRNWMDEIFFTDNDLESLFEYRSTALLLNEASTTTHSPDGPLIENVTTIENVSLRAKKLLAICIYIHAKQLYLRLLCNGVEDTQLPLAEAFLTNLSDSWEVREFLRHQWHFLPMDLTRCLHSHIVLGRNIVVPLIDAEQVVRGAFGEVFRVRIHKSSRAFPGSYGEKFLCKRFTGEPRSRLIGGRHHIATIAKHSHPHLATFLASWTQDRSTYGLFSTADGTLLDLMRRLSADASPRMIGWILEQFAGLVSAVAYVHATTANEIKLRKHLRQPMTSTSYHLDLKPSNILVYPDVNAPEGVGVWKIQDIGVAGAQTDYRSPETSLSSREIAAPNDGGGHKGSRPSDVWALGCILLDLMDWVVEGTKFSPTIDAREQHIFWQDSSQGATLSKWTTDALQQLPETLSVRFGIDAAGLLRAMLSIEPKERPSVATVNEKLRRMQQKLQENLQASGADASDEITVSSDYAYRSTEESSMSSIWASDSSRPGSPDTTSSEDEPVNDTNELFEWQQPAVLPLLVKGIEPRLVVPSIHTSLSSIANTHQAQQDRPNVASYSNVNISGHAMVHLGDHHLVHRKGVQHLLEAENAVLRSLEYEGMGARVEQIEEQQLHGFEPEIHALREWAHGCKDPIYWISGKPGSGKSVFMKTMLGKVTHDNLFGETPSDTRTITINFFFNACGTVLQKSLSGMLRSLLHQILSQQLHLLPWVSKDLYQSLNSLNVDLIESLQPSWHPWTLEQLMSLWRSISDCRHGLPTRILCFIDALDECLEGDEDAGQLVSVLASTPDVRLVVASRPYPSFIRAFRQYSRTIMQDVNSTAIRYTIENRLMQADLESQYKEGFMTLLIPSIHKRAEGVILWARLAVDDVLRGVENSDSEEDLIMRLKELPPYMDDLYSDIFYRRMSPWQRGHATKILQLVLAGKGSIDIQQLRFALDLSNSSTKSVNDIIYGGDTVGRQDNHLQLYLEAYCGGIISLRGTTVQLIHETVRTYLTSTQRGTDFMERARLTDFDAHRAFIISALLLLQSRYNSGESWTVDSQELAAKTQEHVLALDERAPGSASQPRKALASLIDRFKRGRLVAGHDEMKTQEA